MIIKMIILLIIIIIIRMLKITNNHHNVIKYIAKQKEINFDYEDLEKAFLVLKCSCRNRAPGA